MKKLIRFLLFVIILAAVAAEALPYLKLFSSKFFSSKVFSSEGSSESAPVSISELVSEFISEPVSESEEIPDSLDHYCYYYDQLSGEEQKVYLEIYAALKDCSEEQKLSTVDTDLMIHMFSLVQLDHPEFFWTDSCRYVVTSNSMDEVKSISLTPEYTMTESEIDTAEAAISDYCDSFFTYLSDQYDNTGDWQKAVAAFEWVTANADYQSDASYNQNMYSAVLGKTVCQGYATAFKYLCDRMDIPCLIVTGTSETGGSHAWNMVYLNGTWCHVDCTYGDTAVMDFDPDYSWFGISDDLILGERTCTEDDLLPQGDQGQNGYFYQEGFWQDSYDLSLLKDMVKGKTSFAVTFASDEAYDDACEDLFENENVQKLGGGSVFTYVPEDLSRTIYIQISD